MQKNTSKNFQLNNLDQLLALRDRGALFVINHSGGKDSQAMQILIENLVPQSQLLTIHADLIEADWAGCWDHIQDTVSNTIKKCIAIWKDGSEKTFMGMADRRKMWPSPTTRQCTSDLKRGPIEVVVRHHIKENQLSGLVVNCMGIRKEESIGRAKGLDKVDFNRQVDAYVAANPKTAKRAAERQGKAQATATTFIRDNRNSLSGREYYQAYPIFDMTLDQVWNTIAAAGQKPHAIYARGMSRLSCMFCMMASDNDLTVAAKLVPEVYTRYCEKERELDFTFTMPDNGTRRFLPEITGIDPYNNPGPDGTEQQDLQDWDDMDCGGWEKSRDDIQMDLFD